MSFVDRLSGRTVERPPEPAHFGRWLFDPSDGAGHINACPASDGDVLAPGATGGWAFVRVGDAVAVRGRFFVDALPDDQDADALRELGRMLVAPDKAGGGWLEWSQTSPLAPGLDETVKPQPLEDCIEAEIGHLAAVCQNPRTHIRRDAERVLVARARRIARDAQARLASHTEDWEHRTITGIQPRRILADIREERWDLYENRVAVRLVDDLVAWLRKRIDEVRRIRDDVYARMEKIRGSASGTRHRAHRIYTLWGDGWDDSAGGVANATLKRLENLLYKLLALNDSPLYRHIPVRAHAPGGLRTTNLFGNDDHYRGVSRLWREWARLAIPHAPSPSELWARYQSLHRGFDAWCMLVVVRACSQLHLDPVEDEDLETHIFPGTAIRLKPGFRVEWDQIGNITIVDADECRALLRFVPLLHGLERTGTREAVGARVAPLVEAVASKAVWTVILHPAIPGRPPHDALAGVGNPPVPGTLGAIDFIRVSPFSLDNVERVARAIRWAVLVSRMLAYPLRTEAIPESTLQHAQDSHPLLTLARKTWLADSDGTPGWAAVRPPPDRSLQDAAARDLERAGTERTRLEQEREQLRGDRRNDAKRAEIRRRIRHLEDFDGRLGRFVQALRKAHDVLADLATCPACGEAHAAFEAREHDCFVARCKSKDCQAQWSLRNLESVNRVSNAGRLEESRIPVMRSDDSKPNEWPDDAAPQWVDEILGCDVMAIPKGADDRHHRPRDTPRSPELDVILPSGRA